MKATEQLRQEHEAITAMLAVLEKICTMLESGQNVNAEHLERIVEFIRVFADRCHHGKEEDLLFPAMEKAGIPREGGPVAVMLSEHRLGREYVQKMSEAVGGYAGGDRKAARGIVENGRGYIALLTQHIMKENNVLFPMADMHLTDKQQAELEKGFETVEQEKIGAGQHEEFHVLLKNLREVYLA